MQIGKAVEDFAGGANDFTRRLLFRVKFRFTDSEEFRIPGMVSGVAGNELQFVNVALVIRFQAAEQKQRVDVIMLPPAEAHPVAGLQLTIQTFDQSFKSVHPVITAPTLTDVGAQIELGFLRVGKLL